MVAMEPSAIDGNGHAGDPAGPIAQQERGERGDLGRAPEPILVTSECPKRRAEVAGVTTPRQRSG